MTGAIRDIEVESRPLSVRGYAFAFTFATVSAVARMFGRLYGDSRSSCDTALFVERHENFESRTAAN